MTNPYQAADSSVQINQLQQQQALFTQALKAALEGHWTGAGSVEALLYALDPNMQGTLELDVPVTESEYVESPKE
jgi:shikimate kinase